jgi:hypothetical protein
MPRTVENVETAEMKPCPNPRCIATNSHPTVWCPDEDSVWYQVLCVCGLTGPFAPSEDEAIAAWDALLRFEDVTKARAEGVEYGQCPF